MEVWDVLIEITAVLGALFLLIAVILVIRGIFRKP